VKPKPLILFPHAIMLAVLALFCTCTGRDNGLSGYKHEYVTETAKTRINPGLAGFSIYSTYDNSDEIASAEDNKSLMSLLKEYEKILP